MRILLFLLALVSMTAPAMAEAPFRLLTMEAAQNPRGEIVLGAHEAGVVLGPVMIDSNPIMNLGLTPNLGAKLVLGEGPLSYTVGTRYVKFVGSHVLQRLARERSSLVEKFSLEFEGLMSYVGASFRTEKTAYHFNLQHADISGSKVLGAVFAADHPLSEAWSALAELGWDFANHQPRASIGVGRFGPTFGMRLGATYVSIEDPSFTYKGALPVIDLYWILGGASAEPTSEPAPPEGDKP